MKFTKLAITLLCSAMLFCACTKSTDVVLKINGKEITRAQYYEDFNKIKDIQLKNAPKEVKKDDSYAVLSLKDRYTNDLIVRELLSQEFDKRKIQVTDEEIEAKKKQIISQIGSEEQFKNILKENNISDERLKSDMANEVKMDKLVDSITTKKITDNDVKKFYNQNKAQFSVPERVKFSQIFISYNENDIKRQITEADKEAQLSSANIDQKVKEQMEKQDKLAKEVQAKAAKNPANFAKLASEFSQDKNSAKNGGDMGYITKGSLDKDLENAAFSQKVGTVSPLIKTKDGYHIILVKDKAAKGVQPLSAVSADINAFLTRQTKFETFQKFLEGLKQNATIEYVDSSMNPENLKKELDKALAKQIEAQEKQNAPKKKPEDLNKIKKEDKAK